MELKILCNENEELQRRVKDSGDINKKVMESQSRLDMVSQELETTKLALEKKNKEVAALNNKLIEI